MRKLSHISVICLGILSWIFFLFLTILIFSPWNLIKSIDRYFLPSYSIEFSTLNSSGNALNRNLKFFNLNIMQNERTLIKAKELEIGLSFKPQNPFSFLNINNIMIKDGYLDHSNIRTTNSLSSSIVNFSNEISLSFENFKYERDDSMFRINGGLSGDLTKSFFGQLSFLHDNQLSTIAVNAFEDSYRLSLNLHQYKWLNFIPAFSASPIKDLSFKINALGELQDNQSSIKGSFNSRSLFLQSLLIKPNKGSFHFQSKKNIGTLTLTKFLHPFVDEAYPIQIHLKEKSVAVPRFFLSPQILQIETLKLTNLIIENFFVSFDNFIPSFSGFIKDLDLEDLYFKEITNLSGNFSGHGSRIKFLINSDNLILKNHNQNSIPASIAGVGNFSPSVFDLKARIKDQSAGIDLDLEVIPGSNNPFSIELKGNDISKDLIIFSLPNSLKGVGSYIERSINLGRNNAIYFNYSVPRSGMNADLKAKILIDESRLTLNEDSTIDLVRPIIEADSKNLYIFSPSGKVTNFSYDKAYGLINYKTQKLSFYSLHNMQSIELRSALNIGTNGFSLPDIQAEHKGEMKLSNLRLNNAISIKTKFFSIPILQHGNIDFNDANIFIVDLDSIYGLLPSTFMKDELSVRLSGKSLTKIYDLTFSTPIYLEPGNFITDSTYLQISGNDLFKIDLKIQKNSQPILKINSNLKNIQLNSPLNALSKNKLIELPTEIIITNFLNPSLKVNNQNIDMHIRDLSKYHGYISIGKKLPNQHRNFTEEPGLNIYLNSKFISEDLLSSILSISQDVGSVQLNKLAFDIKNLRFFNNNFSNLSGLFDLNNSEILGNLIADNLSLKFRMDQTGFMKIEINNSIIPDIEFINFSQSSFDTPLNSRLIISNSSFGKIKIKDLDVYLLNNNRNFTANNLQLTSNLISIKPLKQSSIAYFSVDKFEPLYKIRGDFLIKDSSKIPYLGDFLDFSYFNGSINLQWKELSTLSYIEGESNFILKDAVIKDSISDSLALNLLGVLNLRNILGKLANFDLSIDEFTSTQLGRVEGDLLFSKSKLRLVSPLFIETNAAKMKWVGQINKNSKNNLDDLDLNLDLRIRVGENLPWYAAILGGLPAVAGSAVINEIFKEDINNLTNYQYEVLGTISQPRLERIKQEIR